MAVDNGQDMIDSRAVIERLEELAATWQAHANDPEELELDEEELEELRVLTALAEECEGCAEDWHYGVTLIRYSYFEDYARDLAEECDLIPSGTGWPLTCIDWTKAARELKQDYTSVDFDGIEYFIR